MSQHLRGNSSLTTARRQVATSARNVRDLRRLAATEELPPTAQHEQTILGIASARRAVDAADASPSWKSRQLKLLGQLEAVAELAYPLALPVEGQWTDVWTSRGGGVPLRWKVDIATRRSENPLLDEKFTFALGWDFLLGDTSVLPVAREPEHWPRLESPIDSLDHPLWRHGVAYLEPEEMADLQLPHDRSGISPRPGFESVYAIVEQTRGLQSLVRLVDRQKLADRLTSGDGVFTEGERRLLSLNLEDLHGRDLDAVFLTTSSHPSFAGPRLIVERAMLSDLLPDDADAATRTHAHGKRAENLWRIRAPSADDRNLFFHHFR